MAWEKSPHDTSENVAEFSLQNRDTAPYSIIIRKSE